MAVKHPVIEEVCSIIDEQFTMPQLEEAIRQVELPVNRRHDQAEAKEATQSMHWLAKSNYHIELAQGADLSELGNRSQIFQDNYM